MALTTTKKITLKGIIKIGNTQVQQRTAEIDSENPSNMVFSGGTIYSQEMYKANRVQCRADMAEFEDYAYEVQDAMIAEAAADSTGGNE